MKKIFSGFVATLVLGFGTQALASGFALMEQDSESSARGLAVTAKLENPATLFFNPAGMTFLNGWNASIGATGIIPDFNYSDPAGVRDSAKASMNPIWDPHFYLSYTFKDKASVGIGFNAPYGLALEWPEGFAGEHESSAVDLKMPTVYIGVAARPIKELSFGATLRVIYATVEMERRWSLLDSAGNQSIGGLDLSASAIGVGASIGIMARPLPWIHVGASYLSRVKFDFDDGKGHFETPDNYDNILFHDQGGTTEMTTPDTIAVGIGFDITKNVFLELDYNFTLWEVYDELQIKFDRDPTGTLSQAVAKDWKNTHTLRLGLNYKINDEGTLRAGFVWDQAPAPDHTVSPDLPDSDRLVGSIGGGYHNQKYGIKVDAYFMVTSFLPREVTAEDGEDIFPASYSSRAYLFGVTLGYASPKIDPPEQAEPVPAPTTIN